MLIYRLCNYINCLIHTTTLSLILLQGLVKSNVGHFGYGCFGQEISAMEKIAKGGRFGHNHKFMCLYVCMDGLMFVCVYQGICACVHASMRV